MARKKEKISIIPLTIGILLLVMAFSVTYDRQAKPVYDGQADDFRISLENQARNAEAGETYWVEIIAENRNSAQGEMWIQCGFLDAAASEMDWLLNVPELSLLNREVTLDTYRNETIDNCFDGPNVQTRRERLNASGTDDSRELVRFAFQTPTNFQDPQLYCAAYEQCYVPGVGAYQTSEFRRPITIVASDGIDDESGDSASSSSSGSINTASGHTCQLNSDCKGSFFNKVICHNKLCMDADDVPCNPKCGATEECQAGKCVSTIGFDDQKIRNFVLDHRIAVTIVALTLVLVGIFGTYRTPKDLGL